MNISYQRTVVATPLRGLGAACAVLCLRREGRFDGDTRAHARDAAIRIRFLVGKCVSCVCACVLVCKPRRQQQQLRTAVSVGIQNK